MIKRMFLDCETSPDIVYSWRTGYNLDISHENIVKERQIICICWKWEGQSKVETLTWDEDSDKTMLEQFLPIMEEADQLIAHNGDRFDIPWIRGRCLYHRIPCPSEFPTLDTLKAARGRFALNSYRLDYLSKFLGFKGKIPTGGFQLWKDVMTGDEKALRKMVKYCQADVVRLEEIYREMEPYIPSKLHVGVMEGRPRWSCSRCGSESVISNGPTVSATGMVKHRMHCKNCGGYFRIADTLRKQMLNETHGKSRMKSNLGD